MTCASMNAATSSMFDYDTLREMVDLCLTRRTGVDAVTDLGIPYGLSLQENRPTHSLPTKR